VLMHCDRNSKHVLYHRYIPFVPLVSSDECRGNKYFMNGLLLTLLSIFTYLLLL
jgi:hypothetical protein